MQTQTASLATPDFLGYPVTDTERNFKAFHERNPHVYAALEELAQRAANKGVKRLGINAMIETLRYSAALQSVGDQYKINNSYGPLYARLLIANHPPLSLVLVTRARTSASPYAG